MAQPPTIVNLRTHYHSGHVGLWPTVTRTIAISTLDVMIWTIQPNEFFLVSTMLFLHSRVSFFRNYEVINGIWHHFTKKQLTKIGNRADRILKEMQLSEVLYPPGKKHIIIFKGSLIGRGYGLVHKKNISFALHGKMCSASSHGWVLHQLWKLQKKTTLKLS